MGTPLESFADQPFGRDRTGGAVNAGVRHLAQPPFDRQVGGLSVDDQPFLGESAGERNPEALAQITDEALHFALGLRPIRRAQARLGWSTPGAIWGRSAADLGPAKLVDAQRS